MQQAELTTFLVLINSILLIFIIGVVLFFVQYARARKKHVKEKDEIHRQHQIELLSGRLDMQQKTMQHIGREIHDSVGQKLTLAALYAQQLEFENKYPGINKRLVDIGTIVNDCLAELRDLSKSLVNEQYDKLGLVELIDHECSRIRGIGLCEVSFESNSAVTDLSPAEKNVMLRIVQEFMQNSLKHAACSIITIQLASDDKKVAIKATDNGKGFDIDLVNSPGLGLNNMKRRAALVGASFELNSTKGNGTQMHLFLMKEKVT